MEYTAAYRFFLEKKDVALPLLFSGAAFLTGVADVDDRRFWAGLWRRGIGTGPL
ncbi:hypothetical protein H7347_03735 [Corynebacterium sp. zg-331]|uniref:hypothetical protein n=1 Tax=unclassified Corynebacterium TaxID=2624378 RepID=UPI0016428009|nr:MULTISPECIES: hypothetical protein [unclassified Corynebacterium]MBC3185691.1 hypothetical protein [Corynebacterium sp. zg-331]